LAYDLTTKTHDISSLRVYRGKPYIYIYIYILYACIVWLLVTHVESRSLLCIYIHFIQ
jgi:hypothetical protein